MIPRVSLAKLPTPLEALPRLSEALGGPKILIKRDDLTGLALGGNKARKLEFTLGDAKARGARTLVTLGAQQSNHCRQTAAAAARYGFDCILVLAGEKPAEAQGNLLLDELFGARVVWTGLRSRNEVVAEVFEQALAAERAPYLIPVGASNAIGVLGYRNAFQEMAAQTGRQDITWLVVASGSGGTQAGLVLGAREANWEGRVLGVSVDLDEAELKEHVAFLANETAGLLDSKVRFEPLDILVNADYRGEGYGRAGDAEWEAIRLFARLEGIVLDPVYSGRAAAAMLGLIRSGFMRRGETVLFWHTGGQPALFAEPYRTGLAQVTARE